MEDRQGPYVVTEDLECLLNGWALAHGFRMPGSGIFGDLRGRLIADLKTCLTTQGLSNPEILYLRHDDLRARAGEVLARQQEGAPFVTLDAHYYPDVHRIVDVTRHVLPTEDGWVTRDGVGVRASCLPLASQIERVAHGLPPGIRSIRLLDDGLWSGETTLTVTRAFAEHGVTVHEILVALLVESRKTLKRLGTEGHPPIRSLVRTFSVEEGGVIDWVCKRDFYPGVPLGGRTLAPELADCRDVGVYYLDLDGSKQLGDPKAWATLDGPFVATFSRNRIEDCIALFSAIGHESRGDVTMKDLDRIPYGFGGEPDERFVDVLRRKLDSSPAT